jgi:ion channel-forming bestrophin family protein
LKPAQNPPPITIFDFIPVLGFIRWIIRKLLRRARPDGKRRRGGRKYEVGVESHIPLEISLILSK